MPEINPAPAAAPAPAATPAAAAAAPAPAAPGAAPMMDRARPPMGGPIRRSDSSRCRTPNCMKYHDFFQWNGKYYCLECYHALHSATKLQAIPTLAPAAK